MKTLWLVRHAKSEAPREPELADSERSLTKKGKKTAQKMARRLRKNSPPPRLIISSPAKRALQTARIIAAEFDYPPEAIVVNETLYHQPEEQGEAALLEMIRALDNQYESVMIVGHDPLLSKFARFLHPDFAENLPAGAVAEFELPIRSWKQLKAGAAALKSFDFPGREKQLRKERQSDLQAKIEAAIRRVAGKAQPEIAETLTGTIQKVSRKLARELVKELESSKKAPQAGEETLPEEAAAPETRPKKKSAPRGGRTVVPAPAKPPKVANPAKAARRKPATALEKAATPKRATVPKQAAAPTKALRPKPAASSQTSVTAQTAAKLKKAAPSKRIRGKRESQDAQ